MVKQIVRDIFFLGQPSEPATKADRHYCVVPYGIRCKNAALRLTGSFASWCSN